VGKWWGSVLKQATTTFCHILLNPTKWGYIIYAVLNVSWIKHLRRMLVLWLPMHGRITWLNFYDFTVTLCVCYKQQKIKKWLLIQNALLGNLPNSSPQCEHFFLPLTLSIFSWGSPHAVAELLLGDEALFGMCPAAGVWDCKSLHELSSSLCSSFHQHELYYIRFNSILNIVSVLICVLSQWPVFFYLLSCH